MNFGLGQSNDFLLGLVGGMLWADSRGRWGLMGALIVFAALFKLWLLGLLVHLASAPTVETACLLERGRLRRGPQSGPFVFAGGL